MNATILLEFAFGAAGGLLDGYLRQKPLAESSLTGLAIRTAQTFASYILINLGISAAFSSVKANGNWKPVAVLASLASLAARLAILYAAFHYGYIGNAVALGFTAIDAIANLKMLANISQISI